MRIPGTLLSSRALLPIALLLLGGCAAHHPASITAPVLPPQPIGPPPEPPIDLNPVKSSLDRQVEQIIEIARNEYRLGVEALRAEQNEAAREHFDRSIETLLDAPVPVSSDQRLSEAFNELVESIHAMELEVGDQGAGAEDEAPVEQLDRIEPTITPQKAQQELAIASQSEVTYDIPMVLNNEVLAWIDIYTGPMRERFEAGLKRSGWYLDMIRRIFREEGLPEDLAYMVHVESSYKPHAYSRAKAKGIWQFIAATGRRYGLKRDWWIDERSDPEMATRAAADYLRDLYAMFGDWYLAMASYNAGEGKVQRATERVGSKDFWTIAHTSQLRRETKNYVPAILAATVISKSPEKFGFTLEREPAVIYDKVAIDQPMDLRIAADCAGTTVEEMRRLNPSLYRLQTPPGYAGFELRLPAGSGQAFDLIESSLSSSERFLSLQHVVRKGETLAAVARRYGVPVAALARANNLSKTASVRAGATLIVPAGLTPLTGLHPDLPGSSGAISRSSGKRIFYKVRHGDTLSSIARRYGTTVERLAQDNDLGSRKALIPGRRLVIGRKRGAAQSSSSASSSRSSGQVVGKKRSSSAANAASGGRVASNGGTALKSEASNKVTYKVRKGDTLNRIASLHGSTVEQVCRWNGLSKDDPLRPGRTLVIYR